jgi:hypothetical protein
LILLRARHVRRLRCVFFGGRGVGDGVGGQVGREATEGFVILGLQGDDQGRAAGIFGERCRGLGGVVGAVIDDLGGIAWARPAPAGAAACGASSASCTKSAATSTASESTSTKSASGAASQSATGASTSCRASAEAASPAAIKSAASSTKPATACATETTAAETAWSAAAARGGHGGRSGWWQES